MQFLQDYVLANSADPDEMRPYRGFQSTKGYGECWRLNNLL